MNRRALAALVLGVTMVASAAVWVAGAGAKTSGATRQYLVLSERGASPASVSAAVAAAGGRIVRANTRIGLFTVVSRNAGFIRAATRSRAIRDAGRNRPVGRAIHGFRKELDPTRIDDTLGQAAARGLRGPGGRGHSDDPGGPGKSAEPLAGLQWDMAMIHATKMGSQREQKGRQQVLVGIIDSGVDGTHPDIAPNFSTALSRNFAPDIPGLDDGCGGQPAPCLDPANVDPDGHGTHVAGVIGAAANNLGIAGVAPRVTLVSLRAMQDSGYFFLQPTLDAMTYAADNGIDVVNMSYFTDPWLFNCRANPADSPAEQAEQSLIIDATQRAADYARAHGVTLVAALGNEDTDLGLPAPIEDGFSPDFPAPGGRVRTVDDSCIQVPTETDGVIGVSAVGPSGDKADYSNYGVEQTDLAAPGGFLFDRPGTPAFGTVDNLVLSAYPASIAAREGQLNPDGSPNTPKVVRDCRGSTCGYYQYLEGTSMAAPHVAGVAALIVSEFGSHRHGPGITMDPARVERILEQTATKRACPAAPPPDGAVCQDTPAVNGFFGNGVVDALAAVGDDRGHR